MAACEEEIRKLGVRLLIVEISGMSTYQGTRDFYRATGYVQEVILKEFYSDGDDLVIFSKRL